MKTTAFKVFALCAAIVCLASSAASRATTENPFDRAEKKNLFGQEDVLMNLKRYITWTLADEMELIHASAEHEESHRQRRSYDHDLDNRLRKELEGDDSPDSIEPTSRDAVRIDPDGKYFEDSGPQSKDDQQDSQQSNDVKKPQRSNSGGQDSQQSNDVESPLRSDSGSQDSQQSNDVETPLRSDSGSQDSQQSNDVEKPLRSDSGSQDSQQPNDVEKSHEQDEESLVQSDEPYELNESDRDDVSAESGGHSYPDKSRTY